MNWRKQSKFKKALFKGEPVLIIYDEIDNKSGSMFLLYKETPFEDSVLNFGTWTSHMSGSYDPKIYELIHTEHYLNKQSGCFKWHVGCDRNYLTY